MTTPDTEETETTFGTGKMLALFFVLVACCALFFGLGYSMGRSSNRSAAATSGTTAPAVLVSGQRPSDQTPQETSPVDSSASDSPAPAVPVNASQSGPVDQPAAHSYYLQVAAVTKQEDAEALVAALRKKQYQVFATSNLPADKLVHVQVGPFADLKDVDAMKTRLAKDGYTPILKK
jgi:cell division septation protein DedD